MKISNDIITRIKERADIVEVIGQSLALTKRGANHLGVCPFHSDKTPSLNVSAAKQRYTCFACGANGDVINFVKEHDHITFPEAVKQLASKYQIELPRIEQTPEEMATERLRESMRIALTEAQSMFAANLQVNNDARTYLSGRRISPEIVALYAAGSAASDNQLTQLMVQKGHKFETLQSAGICAVSDKGYQYDVFRHRITFPYFDLSGRIIGFTGRNLGEEKEVAKYINSPETKLFTKGNTLFGIYQAKKAISAQDKAYLVEGQFDVLSFVQHGIENTVCGSGTAFTDAQAKLIKRFANKVVLIYDGDAAGLKASIATAKILLAHGISVKGVILPTGDDPDTYAQKVGTDNLAKNLLSLELDFVDYFIKIKDVDDTEGFDRSKLLDLLCECIAQIPDKFIRNEYVRMLSVKYKTSASSITEKIKLPKELKIERWKTGFYGIEEAVELMTESDKAEASIVFSEKYFMDSFSTKPTILAVGSPSLSDIQVLRNKITAVEVDQDNNITPGEKSDPKELETLKAMFANSISINVDMGESSLQFCDYYVAMSSALINDKSASDASGAIVGSVTARCAAVIAECDATVRAVMIDNYAKKLGLKKASLNEVLKPILAKKKDKATLDTQRLNEIDTLIKIDTEEVPEYVKADERMMNDYHRNGFYPIIDSEKRPVAYMFKNPQSSSHSCVSDFFMVPLLHVYDNKDSRNNKRVIQLCHMHKKLDRFVEWQSTTFANLQKVIEKLIEEGAYNFDGQKNQFTKIWRSMSYGFTYCQEIRVFGHQPEGFFAFGNAIFHKVEEKFRIDYTNELGVVSHNEQNYYSPAFSKIYLSDRAESDSYKQARNLMYREIPANNQITFAKWADLMDKVYKINDNGKWALLFSITCAFRDYIFRNRRYFTALFFIGPTSSGKSQVAESIRNLYMSADTQAFNLNTGTDAAFFMILESLRNIPVVMEEYNDKSISQTKFQGLKSATLDGEGKIKVKDVASKSMDSSEINASIVILGQEAAQQDDGALSNRCIMCDVPYHSQGGFTEEETALYEDLKKHEQIGLSNVLIDVLSIRPVVEKHYLSILTEESKKLKDKLKVSVTNTEGLTRIMNACALFLSTCRLIEEHCPTMKLPFSYAEFFDIACDKVLKQLEKISSTNKLSTYFMTISTLITFDRIKIGREIKIVEQDKCTVLSTGKETRTEDFGAPVKVLYLDFEAIYTLYQGSVGKEEALSRQSLRSYFESNQSFIGLCKSTRFTWEVAEHMMSGGITNDEAGEATSDKTARLRMVKKNKQTSAYMFRYEELKALIDIDFERQQADPTTNIQQPGDLPF